jgi:glycosyltransferase involved in cell wall biosynthesis
MKIPCSIGILTLNSETTLARCLESVKDFADIIVADGNSTDHTQAIARSYGCRVIPQYQTTRKNVPGRHWGRLRNKTMRAAKYPWFFWIDSDDYVSPKLVASVRKVTTTPHPPSYVFQFRCRSVIDHHVIKFSSTYPNYRVLLIHQKTRGRFIKPTHERLEWNRRKYPLQTLPGTMYLWWPASRTGWGYWTHAGMHLQLDFNRLKSQSWTQFLTHTLPFNLRVIAMIAVKAPLVYLRHGLKDSMPPSVEFFRLCYHILLLLKIVIYKLTHPLSKQP